MARPRLVCVRMEGDTHTGTIVSTGSQCAAPTSPLLNLPNKLFFKKKLTTYHLHCSLQSSLLLRSLAANSLFAPHCRESSTGGLSKTPSNLLEITPHPIPLPLTLTLIHSIIHSPSKPPPPPPPKKTQKTTPPSFVPLHPPLRTSYAHTIPQTHPESRFPPRIIERFQSGAV